MILPQTSQYALRIMTNVALHPGPEAVRARDVAATINCSSAYVSKVMRKLVVAGLLRAEKGHGGGFVLARPAEKILFSQILNAIEPKSTQPQCIFGWRKCDAAHPCVLHHRWNTVSSHFNEWARTTSLADIRTDTASIEWLKESEPLPARKRHGRRAAQPGQAKFLQQGFQPGGARILIWLCQLQHGHDVLFDCQPAKNRSFLRQITQS